MWLTLEQSGPSGPTQVCNGSPAPTFRVARSVPNWEAGKNETESLQRKVQSPPTGPPALKEEGGPRHKGRHRAHQPWGWWSCHTHSPLTPSFPVPHTLQSFKGPREIIPPRTLFPSLPMMSISPCSLLGQSNGLGRLLWKTVPRLGVGRVTGHLGGVCSPVGLWKQLSCALALWIVHLFLILPTPALPPAPLPT